MESWVSVESSGHKMTNSVYSTTSHFGNPLPLSYHDILKLTRIRLSDEQEIQDEFEPPNQSETFQKITREKAKNLERLKTLW
jgi:hypothetical protein